MYYWRAASYCAFFCGENGSTQRKFIKKFFLFTVGSVCRVKLVTTGWQMFCWWRGWNGCAELAETTDKRLLCCGFRRTGKAMGQMYQCWWRLCQGSNITCCMFYIHLWTTYWLFLVNNWINTYTASSSHQWSDISHQINCGVCTETRTSIRNRVQGVDAARQTQTFCPLRNIVRDKTS
jgi:hypothetical protein